MRLDMSPGRAGLADAAVKLDWMATGLKPGPLGASLTAPVVSERLATISDSMVDGFQELESSNSPLAQQLSPKLSDAMDGMLALSSHLGTTPTDVRAPSTIDAISGWAELAYQAEGALDRN